MYNDETITGYTAKEMSYGLNTQKQYTKKQELMHTQMNSLLGLVVIQQNLVVNNIYIIKQFYFNKKRLL